ncbi:MAG: type II secretion system minor pseudopilin GspK [Betaproteobacteria bacterium]|nr:type II secretion system minor pseudopilin GspK [Betaproteobacteria bacterium]
MRSLSVRSLIPQRGAALIMALLVVALATSLASNLIWRQDLWLRQVETRRDLAQARLLALAGIEWARAILAEDARTSTIDYAGEPWATVVPSMPAEGGEIGGGITDEQGKWNLNNLVRNGQVNRDDLAVLRRLLDQLQLPPALAPALADWLDSDAQAQPEGAEDAYYLSLKPPYRCANRELSDLDNLLRVRGFNSAVIERLRPYASALPGYNPVNVNTASAIVLDAVLADLSSAETQQIIADRDRAPFRDISDFRARLPRELKNIPGTERLDTRSRYFTVSIHARYGNADTSSTALLDRLTPWPALVWQKFE